MPKKPPSLLQLFLHLVLKPIVGQTSAPSNPLVELPQHPLPTDREAWRVHWQAQGQPWRTEPEIDEKRQECLATRRTISPDIKQGIYPFKDIKLNRADVEWLLATNPGGPVYPHNKSQRKYEGLDLRGANLCGVDLRKLPLTFMRGGLNWDEWLSATHEQREMAGIHLERADLSRTHLEEAYLNHAYLGHTSFLWTSMTGINLSDAHLEGASLKWAHLEGAELDGAHMEGCDLSGAFLDGATNLKGAYIGSEQHGFISLADACWDNVNLAVTSWTSVKMLGDEQKARKSKTLDDYQTAVRASRQLAVALQGQGINEEAARFAYRAQVLQKTVFQLQMLQSRVKLKQRARALGAWLFSWFLFLIAGYGYRLWRSFLAYALVIIGFTTVYYLLGASFKPPLSLVNALGLSMTSFHGRGFFPGVTQLNDMLMILASVEAFVGLILEATFIATLTQRFFGK